MRKFIFTFLAIIFSFSLGYSQVTTIWEKSASAGTKPTWDAGSFTRGLSYGFVGGQHLLFVVTRSADVGGKMVVYYNAVTGDSLGTLDLTGVSGGVAVVNDIEVSSDGKIFLGNMTTSASADPFKVYRYDSLKAVPVVALTYNTTAERIGDKFTVTGSTADNSVTIWAATSLASAGAGNLYKFTTTDNAVSFTSSVLPLATTASSAAVGPLPNGDFYLDAHGTTPVRYTAAGTAGTAIPSTVVSTSGSAIRYLRTLLGDEYVVANELLAPSTNFAKIIKVVGGNPANSVVYATSPVLGTGGAGGLGDVSVQKVNDYVYNVYVLASNNGFGAYRIQVIPSLAGNYYIGDPGTAPGGTDPQFPNLRAAFDVLNEAVFTGDCTFYITSNTTETHTSGLGLAINPEPYFVTFKPYAGVQPVVTLEYPTDVNSGPSGALVVGIPSKGNVAWDSLKVTRNVVIDGSNTDGGTTRDLTITNKTTSQRNAYPLAIVGDVKNMVVKNTNFINQAAGVSTSGNLLVNCVIVRSRVQLGKNWVPGNLTFENNFISSNFPGVAQNAGGYGCYDAGTGSVPDYASNITLKNNVIEGKRRAISLYKAGSHDIFGNEIVLNQDIASGFNSEAVYAVDVDTNSVINFYNNRIIKVSTKNVAATFGATGIAIESFGTYNIYNNTITGFELTGANPTSYLRGIKVTTPNATVNLSYNTMLMNDLPSVGTGVVTYQGIYLTDGTTNVKNNIIVNAETDLASNCIYRTGTLGTVVSNYNDFYPVNNVFGFVGYWNTTAAGTLAEWQTLSGQDANSISKEVFFVSASDLHLAGTSIGDVALVGTPVEGITFDFDNELRSTTYPYMGADESTVEIPVELTSFSASVVDGFVQLTWKTITEVNNKGFEVERKNGEAFEVIGFVSGKGTSTDPVNYSFVDNTAGTGKYTYRLKQIDLDGTASYSGEVEVDLSVPFTYGLSQNYPNPFNPSTTISYQIAEPVNVTLTIYNALGAEVAVLINNQLTNPGQHTVQFDASNYASGTYIYRITAGKYVESKKMVLMK